MQIIFCEKRFGTMATKKEINTDEPRIVSSHDIHLDSDYAVWIAEIKHRYRSSQVKAAVRVNAEKLLFNWQLGRDLVQKKAEERWGSGVVEQVSLDLKREFPEETGFSTRNLWYMKDWYIYYTANGVSILQRAVGELQSSINQFEIKLQRPIEEFGDAKVQRPVAEFDDEKLHQLGGEFPLPFALVPWGQHIEIITRCKGLDEAFFYIRKIIEQGLSRPTLVNCIKAQLFEHQGKIVNNFSEHLPELHSKLVQEVLKENYDFGFATVKHEIFDEEELEEALTKNVTSLLLEMGNGFAFIARQKEVIVGGHSRRIDLLFYHIRLRCYVVCELKAKPFELEFAGKLNYYVNAVDDLLKTDDDNPTIGLLICSDLNKTDVKWSFKGVTTPMGVATYNNIRIKDVLPSQKQLQERIKLLQKELREAKRLAGKD